MLWRISAIHTLKRCGSVLIHNERMAANYWRTVEELTIPHPYGCIAAKAWGEKHNYPVLALHGWMDNAGTFDKLIPLLTPSLYIVAVDSPGQGRSSHKPDGSYYTIVDCFVDILRVVRFLKWDRFSIIGHSLGGASGLFFASVFPEQVENIVSLDMIKNFSRPADALPKLTKLAVERIVEFESKSNKQTPVYTLQEAKARLIEGLLNQITPESADILMIRGVKKSECGTGVVFTRDARLKMYDYKTVFSRETLKAYMSKLTFSVLIISATDSSYKSSSPEALDDFLEIYEKHCKAFKHITVDGSHFVHINEPHVIAPYINHFFEAHINETKSKM